MKEEQISFKDAVKILGIEDYSERIWNSHSCGELFHIYKYIRLATIIKDSPSALIVFKKHFEEAVQIANKEWQRPQSVFQHII
jgi:hypothetical protein